MTNPGPAARVVIPNHLKGFAAGLGAPGLSWIQQLPGLVEGCASRWSLTVGPAFPGPSISFVAPALDANSSAVVLKIGFPDHETAHEAEALRLLDGDGAVRLVAADPDHNALLLERLTPGEPLSAVADEEQANVTATGLLRRFWRQIPPDHPFDLLADRAAKWAEAVVPTFRAVGKPFEVRLVEEAAALFAHLSGRRDETFLLHQDFHHGNILSANREPWLIIDPKPLVGERAFDAGSLLRDRRAELLATSAPARLMARRLDLLAEQLTLDRARMSGWALAQGVELGLWSYQAGDVEEAKALIACARLLAGFMP